MGEPEFTENVSSSCWKLFALSEERVTRESSDSTVALLGNSHAQMYVPLVSEVIPNNLDLLLVPLNGCLPTTTINVSQKCLEKARTNLSIVSSDDMKILKAWEFFDRDGGNVD